MGLLDRLLRGNEPVEDATDLWIEGSAEPLYLRVDHDHPRAERGEHSLELGARGPALEEVRLHRTRPLLVVLGPELGD